MNRLDWTLTTPEQNLAADEALLDWCEAQATAEVLRFWEADRPFVVVGYANEVATEVNLSACAARGVPVLRRCTGGGTVLQGPGCLNYTLVLRIAEDGRTRNISTTNQFVMERNRDAVAAAFRDPLAAIEVQGHTDLALDGVKFSGNAQRRKRRCLLFHGTMLLGLDLAVVEQLLPMPSRQPDYRQSRAHRDFICNLPISGDAVKSALTATWHAEPTPVPNLEEAIGALVRAKYGRRDWNLRTADFKSDLPQVRRCPSRL